MGIQPGAGLGPKRRFLWSVLEVHATLPSAAAAGAEGYHGAEVLPLRR